MAETLEEMLTGGHPNSLGRTVEVVELVLANPDRFEELFRCYDSKDAVVRLRTSSAIKRVETENHALLIPYIDRFIEETGNLDQPSAQWTLALLFERLSDDMEKEQREAALNILKRNLANHDDWIVLNNTMETLAAWAKADPDLLNWLTPQLERLSSDSRKSVASRATKKLQLLARGLDATPRAESV